MGNYIPGLVYSQCTETERTMTSLQMVLASLFPPSNETTWLPDLNWQPIAYLYYPSNEDKVN